MSEICGLECKNLPMSIQEVYECLNHVSPLKQKANKQINAKSEKRNDFGKKTMIRRGQFNLLNGASKSKKLIYEIPSKLLTNTMRWIE